MVSVLVYFIQIKFLYYILKMNIYFQVEEWVAVLEGLAVNRALVHTAHRLVAAIREDMVIEGIQVEDIIQGRMWLSRPVLGLVRFTGKVEYVGVY